MPRDHDHEEVRALIREVLHDQFDKNAFTLGRVMGRLVPPAEIAAANQLEARVAEELRLLNSDHGTSAAFLNGMREGFKSLS